MRLYIGLVVGALLVGCSGGAQVDGTDGSDDSRLDDSKPAADQDGGSEGEPGQEPVGGSITDDDDDDDTDGETECDPKTCDELGANCGPVADGCGDVVDCGTCAAGAECGIVEHNVCTVPEDLCQPLSEEAACTARQCGTVGDGCGATYTCGSCEEGELCGLDMPFQCGEIKESNENECEAKVESCAEAGATCGKIGNGCGGIIDCDAELGGCSEGTFCGLGGPEKCGAPPPCVPLTAAVACADRCGVVSNGCGAEVNGGLIDCSEMPEFQCPPGSVCGGGGIANVCGEATSACTPIEQEQACLTKTCGAVSDGCDGSYTCGTCAAGNVCRNGACEAACTPLPTATACAGKECGAVSDGCGGNYDCGTCANGEQCGVQTAFQCDVAVPPECVPLMSSQACAGKECGEVFDGCGSDPGNIIDCASVGAGCSAGEVCGVSTPFQCDVPGGPACTPAASCAALGWECGFAIDDCGNVFDCADEGRSCNEATEACVGGIDAPAQCVTSTGGGPGSGNCDVCGSIPDCSSAGQETTLTGRVITPGKTNNDSANQVGVPNAFVYILRNNDANDLPAVETGIPQDASNNYTEACDRCDDQELGPVLVSATTNSLGEFTLEGNIPVGTEFVLVVKIGKWRRAQKYTVAAGDACSTTAVSSLVTRLPRTMNDGLRVNIPRTAISTGSVDAMECVFFKMGVDGSEFAQPGSSGQATPRIHMYRSADDGGARMASGSSGFTNDTALYQDVDRINSYDMVVFDCEADDYNHNSHDFKVREYVNRGGRMFASHWSYTWLYDNGTQSFAAASAAGNKYDTGLSISATWNGSGAANSDTGYVSLGRLGANASKIQGFADWLVNENAANLSGGNYLMTIDEPRDLAQSVNEFSDEFVYRITDDTFCSSCANLGRDACEAGPNCIWDSQSATCGWVNNCETKSESACDSDSDCEWFNGMCYFDRGCNGSADNNRSNCESRPACGWVDTAVQQYSFNTPYGAPDDELCGRVAYSGFHVVSSNGSYDNSIFPDHCGGDLSAQEKVLLYALFDLGACVSTDEPEPPECTPESCDNRCGTLADGCGGVLDCGGCPLGEVCGGGNVCGPPLCTPTTCAVEGATCGVIADGCGGVLACGDCEAGQECGLTEANQCTPTCTPLAEGTACDGVCGFASDGCGGVYECPDCAGGLTCIDGECTTGSCMPLTACPPELECGTVSDGCDGTLNCGTCTAPEVCGGAGVANQCGTPMCMPLTCQDVAAQCGWIGDGCGGAVFCGDCETGTACGIAGPNQCGGCMPRTCMDAGATCGAIGDGCGNVIQCGNCEAGELCGVSQANQCGMGPSCTPNSCESANAECGLIGDGCGDVVDCGECPAGKVCGIEDAFQCGEPPPCDAQTCEQLAAECGAIGDGCGGLLDCGACAPGATCGTDTPNKCKTSIVTDPH